MLQQCFTAWAGAQKAGKPAITNHLPGLLSARNLLIYEHFSGMLTSATFIHTDRGAQPVGADLLHALQEVPTCMALIDVTLPEVLPEDHVFYSMPNVLLPPHIVGSQNEETYRMAQYMIEEFDRVTAGETPLYEVSFKMLETMA